MEVVGSWHAPHMNRLDESYTKLSGKWFYDPYKKSSSVDLFFFQAEWLKVDFQISFQVLDFEVEVVMVKIEIYDVKSKFEGFILGIWGARNPILRSKVVDI